MSEEKVSAAKLRQQKLALKSQERLAKITGAAKGEGRIISDSAIGINPTPPPQPRPTPKAAPPPPKNLVEDTGPVLSLDEDDPAEVDLSSLGQLQGGPVGLPSMEAGEDPFAGTPFAGMMGGMMGAGPGAGGSGAGGDPFQQMFSSMLSGQGGPPGAPPVSPFPPVKRTLVDRLFPLLHIVAMVGISVYAVKQGGSGWREWGEMLGAKSEEWRAVRYVPLLYMFVTVELVLQTTRLLLIRNRPASPTILNQLLPLISSFSPLAASSLRTLINYFNLFSICLNDLAILIFCVGCAVVWGRYVGGEKSWIEGGLEEVGEGLMGSAGWNKVEL